MSRFLCLLMFASSAHAGVYRCDGNGGAIYYQNDPCPGGTFQRQFRLDTPPPPEFFALPPKEEIRARVPVRVVPPIAEGQVSMESY